MPPKELDMKKWINKLRLSYNGEKYTCKRATFFIEKRHEKRLSYDELVELYLHLIICPFCRLYRVQSAMIQKMIKKIIRTEAGNFLVMDTNVKSNLQQLIEEKTKNN